MEGVFASLGGILELVYYYTTQKIVGVILSYGLVIDFQNFDWCSQFNRIFLDVESIFRCNSHIQVLIALSWKCGRAHFHRVYFLHNHVNFLEASFTNMKWNETKKKQMI